MSSTGISNPTLQVGHVLLHEREQATSRISMRPCAGDLSELEAIAATVSGKENVAGDAAVIQARACELELLVPTIMARQAARADTVLDPQSTVPCIVPAPVPHDALISHLVP